jgi:photosystem II stability/assembly factor-like uncharacterized protein
MASRGLIAWWGMVCGMALLGRATPRLWFVAASACAVLVAGCSAGSTAAHGPAVSTSNLVQAAASASSSSESPVASVSSLLDLTWISDRAGWALTVAACGTGLCPGLVRTTDGGRRWQPMPTPPGAVQGPTTNCDHVACVSHVRFASSSIGYLFGPALFVTRDGGRHWSRQGGLSVEALEPGVGQVVRVAYAHSGCPGPCERLIQEAAPGSSSWHTMLALGHTAAAFQGGGAQIVRAGSAIYVPVYGNLAAGDWPTIIFRSLDGGLRWTQVTDPCGRSAKTFYAAVGLAVTRGGFVAAVCSPLDANRAAFVVTSTNNAYFWGPARPVPGSAIDAGLIAATNPCHLVVASASVSGSGPFTYRLLTSSDGGRHWKISVTDPEQIDSGTTASAYLGFQDQNSGRWVGFPNTIWITHDAGTHWTRLPFR